MTFHPDQNLPGCMMPDGGDCCTGHAAVCDDWHKQRLEIERLRGEVDRLSGQLVLLSVSSGVSDLTKKWRPC